MTTRQTKFGFDYKQPISQSTVLRFAPVDGYTELPDVQAPPTSIVSGQNVWIRQNRLQPRWRLARASTNNLHADVPNGGFVYQDINGTHYPVVTSQGTVAYLNGQSFVSLVYVSGASNLPPSGGEGDRFYGTATYLPRRDLNILAFTNGVDPIFAWGGPSDSTGFSTLTEAPIAQDVSLLGNRLVAWNIRELSSNTRYVQRVMWTAAGNPESWTTIGSGAEDLVDMRGEGTRIFTDGDQLVVASDHEVWRGRRTGDAYVFSFSPADRTHGIPFANAAIQTPLGIFWLNSDFCICRWDGNSADPSVGIAIQRTLRDTLINPLTAFFGYNPETRQLTFYYQGAGDSGVNRAWSLNVSDGVWTPQRFTHDVRLAMPGQVASSATTWGALAGSFASQTLTYQQLAGRGYADTELVMTSGGTLLAYNSSAESDDAQTVATSVLFGGLFTQDSRNMKLLDVVRLDLRATSASNVTLSVSGNIGGSYQSAALRSVSVQSNSSQAVLYPKVAGAYFALGLDSSAGLWELTGMTVEAHNIGSLD